jgi:fused signal recognition particle receptor
VRWFKRDKQEENEKYDSTDEQFEQAPEEQEEQNEVVELEDDNDITDDYQDAYDTYEEPAIENDAVEEGSASWFSRLKSGLKKSRENIIGQISGVIALKGRIDDEVWDDIEAILVQADLGVNTTMRIIDNLKDKVSEKRIQDTSIVIELLKDELADILKANEARVSPDTGRRKIYLIVGVNGTGKTTTIAKLARNLSLKNKSVLLGAADTFRAAAVEQLDIWAKRLEVDIVKHDRGADPAAVVYDAIHAANARKSNILLIDTAGRLHTYSNLMEELKKIKRIADRERGDADLETLLVIDATTGQNGIAQARLFDEALTVDGIVLTKLDGTAKGGIVLAIQEELQIPIRYVGVGEGMNDLREFDPGEFVKALVGEDI